MFSVVLLIRVSVSFRKELDPAINMHYKNEKKKKEISNLLIRALWILLTVVSSWPTLFHRWMDPFPNITNTRLPKKNIPADTKKHILHKETSFWRLEPHNIEYLECSSSGYWYLKSGDIDIRYSNNL